MENSPEKPSYFIPALVGAVIIVVPSLILFDIKVSSTWFLPPFFFILGGAGASWWSIRETPTQSLKHGGLLGLFAGAIGGGFLLAGLWVSLTPEKHHKAVKLYREHMQDVRKVIIKELPDQDTKQWDLMIDSLREAEKNPKDSFESFRGQIVFRNVFFTVILGVLGGLIGTLLFRKKGTGETS